MLLNRKINQVFFDLDMTLWDFETNAFEAYQDIYKKFGFEKRGIKNIEEFLKVYLVHNDRLWDLYRKGKVEKEYLRSARFELTLLDFGINDSRLAEDIGMEYITISPQKTNLFPHAHETLQYLKPKYPMFIITNGFEEVQFTKLKNSKLDQYFQGVVTSEEAGCKKPDAGIFEYALSKAGAKAAESIMIGDDAEVDVQGALNIGMAAIWFNPGRVKLNGFNSGEIHDLIELKKIL